MAIAVHKTARSSMLRIGDFATALADGQGGMVGLGRFHMLALTVFSYLRLWSRSSLVNSSPATLFSAMIPIRAVRTPDVILVAKDE
jgi:hypothetical protein